MVIGVTAITSPVTATDLRTRVIAAPKAQATISAASADAASRSAQTAWGTLTRYEGQPVAR